MMLFSRHQIGNIWLVALVTTSTHAFVIPVHTGRSSGRQASSLSATEDSTDIDLNGKLRNMGFSNGLREHMICDSLMTEKRFWILDNSGSMASPDGRRLIIPKSSGQPQQLSLCTRRWKELQETAIYHAQLAGILQVPTEFCFLNSQDFWGAQHFR